MVLVLYSSELEYLFCHCNMYNQMTVGAVPVASEKNKKEILSSIKGIKRKENRNIQNIL